MTLSLRLEVEWDGCAEAGDEQGLKGWSTPECKGLAANIGSDQIQKTHRRNFPMSIRRETPLSAHLASS